MIQQFERPLTVDEALDLRQKYGKRACWMGGWAIAGGRADLRDYHCAIVLDGIRVQGVSLSSVEVQPESIRVGALTCLQDIMDHPEMPPVLRAAAGFQLSRALRCMGTLGGDVATFSLDNSRAESCLCVPLTALGTMLELGGDALVSIPQYAARSARDLILFARIPRRRVCAVARHSRNARGPVLLTAAVGRDVGGDSGIIVAVQGIDIPLQRLHAVEKSIAEGLRGAALEKLVRATLERGNTFHTEQTSAAYSMHLAATAVADCAVACDAGRVVVC